VTGGSRNMMNWFQLMLTAGATARQLLLNAAAIQYPGAPTPLKAVAGEVRDNNGALVATYGALAPMAATLTLSAPAPLLSKTRGYKLVGTSVPRRDIPLKVNGSAVFGLDVRVAGMVYAVVKHCPVIGGTVGTMPAAPAGTLGVVNLGNAVAVVGDKTWKAMQVANKLQVSWVVPSESALAAVDTSSLSSQAKSLMSSGTPYIAETMGVMADAMAFATQTLNLTYSLPFLPHASMEVLNCTTAITKDATDKVTGCEIWVSTQAPDSVAKTAAALTGLLATQVIVHANYLGGGLGRKIEQDYVSQSIKVAMAMSKPVKTTWSREDDFARDWCRPSALSRVVIGLDAGSKITGWSKSRAGRTGSWHRPIPARTAARWRVPATVSPSAARSSCPMRCWHGWSNTWNFPPAF
jgi:isoquinoline 1-oxidoreductase beta subunit